MENYKKIREIKNAFGSYYGMAGYHKIPATSLVPENDQSILFSNSAVLPFKPFLQEPAPRLFNMQKCIRFRGGRDLLNLDEPPYISTFEMAGCLTPAKFKTDFLYETNDFLFNTLHADPNRLFVDISSQDPQFIDMFSDDYPIEIDRFPQEKYDGNFGLKNVTGRCIHFSMQYGNNKTHNFGKIIEIYSDGQISNYAFGFGIEKFLYMHDNKENYYEATSIYDLAKDLKSPIAWKYMNALSAMCHLHSEKIDYNLPQYAKQKKLVRSMSYKLSVIMELLDISDIRLRRDTELYSKIEYDGKVDVERVIENVTHARKNNLIHNNQIQHFKNILLAQSQAL